MLDKRWMRRLRRPHLKAARRRRGVSRRLFFIVVAGFAALSSGVWMGSLSGNAARAIRSARAFELRSIEIHGNRRIGREKILKKMALGRRTTLVEIRLSDVRDRLMGDPWIRRVTLHKIFPHELWVDIAERDAAAVIPIGTRMGPVKGRGPTGLYGLVDADGVLLGDLSLDPGVLPRVDGLNPAALSIKDPSERARLRSALNLLAVLKQGPLAARIGGGVWIAVSRSDEVSVDLAGIAGRQNGFLRLKFGRGASEEQVRRYLRVEKELERRSMEDGIAGSEVDLRFPRQVIVRPLA